MEVSLASDPRWRPAASTDFYATRESSPLIVSADQGLLSNDLVLLAGTLIEITQSPAHGAVSVNPDGGFTYTPSAGYHGADSFVYRLQSGSLVSSSTAVSLSVAEVNDALRARGIFGGRDLSADFPTLGQSALYAVTEIHNAEDIARLAGALREIVA